jgi:copper homeostasis protein
MAIEICAANLQSVISAVAGGADRVELCDNLWEGGTTPSAGMIKLACSYKIGVFVLIRPRGGDFLYNDLEFKSMLEDISLAKTLGAKGIVSGLLNKNGTVDINRTIELVEHSYPLPFTFHRAFDCSADLFESLEDIIQCGAKRILTSGGSNNVSEGLETIKKLNELARDRIVILPGGGINSSNIQQLKKETGCTEFHLSAKKMQYSPMSFVKSNLKMNAANIPEDGIYISDAEEIKKIVKIVKS